LTLTPVTLTIPGQWFKVFVGGVEMTGNFSASSSVSSVKGIEYSGEQLLALGTGVVVTVYAPDAVTHVDYTVLQAEAKRGAIYYATLADAVTAAAGTEAVPDVITVLRNIRLTEGMAITTGKHIAFTVPDSESYTIKRYVGDVALFAISGGAKLNLEAGTGGALTIDGNKTAYASVM
jgi:hypothetical protein